MLNFIFFLIPCLFSQQIGSYQKEVHPSITWEKCSSSGCVEQKGGIVLDVAWRWKHVVGDYTDCDTTASPLEIAQNCAVEGVDYESYGVVTQGNELSMQFVVPNGGVGSRLYFLGGDDETYEGFYLKNKEFTYDVDTSEITCGMNAALYFIQMDLDGGMKRGGDNKAGAVYGTGYCDAQCPKGNVFVNGLGNWDESTPFCCFETDIWEANNASTVYTLHNCPNITGATVGENECDRNGCGFNHYANGDKTYYGPGLKIDTSKKFTVVTQFVTDNGRDDGVLVEVRRLYVQDGVVYNNSVTNNGQYDSISDGYCDWAGSSFTKQYGGIKDTSRALDDPQVLTFALWASSSGMSWLDSGNNGPCDGQDESSSYLQENYGDSKVYFSNIKWGEIDSTY